jgi:HEAT repeat protein
MDVKERLEALFEADRKLREHEARLLSEAPPDELSRTLESAAQKALAREDDDEAAARLLRIADLCAQVQGPKTADTLLAILNHSAPEVRVAAGEALRDFAYDRYAEVARAIERAFERDVVGPCLQEVPWILAEIAEPSAVPLIGRCLRHHDLEVVASGIEALAELGDPSGAKLLKPLVDDPRVVQLEDGDAAYSTTIGELAREALDELEAE